ncbi:putative ribosomal protein S17e [Helianthus anomalus]
MDIVLDESAIKFNRIEVDKEAIDLLTSLGMSELPRIVFKEYVPVVSGGIPSGYGGGGRGGFGGGGRGGFGGAGGAGRRLIQVQHYKFNLCFVLFYMFLIKCFYLIFVIVLRFGSLIP